MQSNVPLQAVCVFDPAIDNGVSDVVSYGKHRQIDKLRFKDGSEPVRYFVDRLTRRVMLRYVCTADTDNERYTRAFACAVAKVTGLDGGEYRAQHEQDSVAGKVRMIDEEDLERFAIADILEIGAVAYWHSFLRPGSAVSYPLLASSATAYDMMRPGSPSAESEQDA